MFDIKIINGTVVDGTGAPRYRADVGICGDRITAIGDLSNEAAEKVIDAAGKIVSPGFIDIHTHSDLSILYDPYAGNRIHNGVTSDVIGNCGIGPAPVCEENRELLVTYLTTRIAGSIPVKKLELPWNTFGEYLDYVESKDKAINIIPLLAQGPIRIKAMGFSTGTPTPEQMEEMKQDVREGMEAGACGFTSGLIYLPGLYTTAEELTELCKEVAPYGVKYITHHRSEGNKLYEALDEDFRICQESGVGLHISHIKMVSPQVWGHVDRYFDLLEEKRKEGLDISTDAYPYICGMSPLSYVIPAWCFESDGVPGMLELLCDPEQRSRIEEELQKVYIAKGAPDAETWWKKLHIANVTNTSGKWMEGKSLPELAELYNKPVETTICDILLEQDAKVQVTTEAQLNSDMEQFISHKDVAIGSDSMAMSNEGVFAGGKTHPRAFGTQGTVLRHFVRETGKVTLEDAIRKMTALPAELTKIDSRGYLKEGYYADVVVFDPGTVSDHATYQNPKQYTTGVEYVVVNGQVVMEDEVQKPVFPGRVLRRK